MEQQLFPEMKELQCVHWWFTGRRKILTRCLESLIGVQSRLNILDAGSGTGANIDVLLAFGDVIALEPNALAGDHIAHTTGVPVVQGTLPDIPFRLNSFDLIVALDVLEHVHDDQAAMIALYEVLRPGGCVVLTVPAYSFMWSGHDIVHGHYRRYSRGEVSRRLKMAGFAIEFTTHFNSFLFPVVAVIRLAGRILSRSRRSQMKLPPRWLNSVLARIMSAESLFIGRVPLPFGTSILATARKD